MKIKMRDLLSKEQEIDLFEQEIEARVKQIRKIGLLNKKYTKATIKARKRHGLQASKVDLTGNKSYSGKNYRTLDDWNIKVVGNQLHISFNNKLSKTIFKAQTKRYGKIL